MNSSHETLATSSVQAKRATNLAPFLRGCSSWDGLCAYSIHVLAVAAISMLILLPHGNVWADDSFGYCASNSDPSKLNDYRLRNSTPFMKWSIEDNMTAHTRPAIERINAGEFSRRVMADLDFTLRGWPNHMPALQALIAYDLGGGRPYEFLPIECYFARARQFVPNDVNVLIAEAYYLSRKGNVERAKATYEEALALAPHSAEAHYNLGLLYFDSSEFAKALEQAHAAYSAGYPLPGLRRMLVEEGYWREPRTDKTD